MAARDVRVEIRNMPDINGQFSRSMAYERRVSEEYVILGSQPDAYVSKEGIYPCSVVPSYDLGKTLTVVFRSRTIDLNPDPDSHLFKESVRGFDETVVERHIVPSKGRLYYSETEWMESDSKEGTYPTLIFQKGLVGKVVTLFSQKQQRT